ncbi:TPA: hypothetical protein ACH3X1_009042 [Trebouxia sp. C0004]
MAPARPSQLQGPPSKAASAHISSATYGDRATDFLRRLLGPRRSEVAMSNNSPGLLVKSILSVSDCHNQVPHQPDVLLLRASITAA